MALSDLNFGWPVVLGLVVAGFVGLWVMCARLIYARSKTIRVQRKSRFLSVAERTFFDCLIDELSDKYFVFAKVAINNVVEPSPSARTLDVKCISEELKGLDFDFVLCSQNDMSIYGVVELEHSDKNKVTRKGKQRQKLVGRACKSAGLKLFYFDVRQDYKSMDIARLITGKSKKIVASQDQQSPTHQSQLTIDSPSHSVVGNIRNCPKCRSEVVTKVSVKGSNIGEKFLMCRKYPYCDYRLSMSEVDEMNTAEQQAGSHKTKAGGYKNWSSG